MNNREQLHNPTVECGFAVREIGRATASLGHDLVIENLDDLGIAPWAGCTITATAADYSRRCAGSALAAA